MLEIDHLLNAVQRLKANSGIDTEKKIYKQYKRSKIKTSVKLASTPNPRNYLEEFL